MDKTATLNMTDELDFLKTCKTAEASARYRYITGMTLRASLLHSDTRLAYLKKDKQVRPGRPWVDVFGCVSYFSHELHNSMGSCDS